MFPKLLFIILIAGATAAALLANRQQRIDTAHEIAVLHQRLQTQEQTLWRLQSEVAQRIRPERVRQYKDNLGGAWVAIPVTPKDVRRPVIRLALHEDEVIEFEEDMGG